MNLPLRDHYDRFGARQDRQAWYEDKALDALIRHGRFEDASRVIELGCGTGRYAARLFADHLPEHARYLGLDISETMVALARRRLVAWEARAQVRQSDGAITFAEDNASADRVVATYVADLLSVAEQRALVDEAARVLQPGGLLLMASLDRDPPGVARLTAAAWQLAHRMTPLRVGGCRPVALRPLIDEARWSVAHMSRVTSWGLGSQVLIAQRTDAAYPRTERTARP
ncbi:MAG: class I SAM-dependent methyltransferase [Pseudomonadota bacterium]